MIANKRMIDSLLILLFTSAILAQAQDPDSIVDERKSRGLDSSFEARERLHSKVIGREKYTGSAEQNTDLLKWYRQDKLLEDHFRGRETVVNSHTCPLYSFIPGVGINSVRVRAHATVIGGQIPPGNLKVSADGHPSATFLMTVTASSPTAAAEAVSLVARPVIKLPTSGDIMFNRTTIDVARPMTLHINGRGSVSQPTGLGHLGSCSTELRF